MTVIYRTNWAYLSLDLPLDRIEEKNKFKSTIRNSISGNAREMYLIIKYLLVLSAPLKCQHRRHWQLQAELSEDTNIEYYIICFCSKKEKKNRN